MASQRERISKGLDLLSAGLFPFVEREMKAVYKEGWHDAARASFRKDTSQLNGRGQTIRWDAHAVLTVIWDQWNAVFRRHLDALDRSLIAELREFRNRWAHQMKFDFEDTYRVLDSIERLLNSVAAEEAKPLAREKRDLMRHELAQEAKEAYRHAQVRKRKMQDFAVYLVCCLVTVFALVHSFGQQAWVPAGFVVLAFCYIAWQRHLASPPVFFSAHECVHCNRIIYSDRCPYCEPPASAKHSRRQRTAAAG